MFINLLLVSRECLSGCQSLERAVYLPTTKNSLKTNKTDLLCYGQSEVLPTVREHRAPSDTVPYSDSESVDSAFSSTRPKTKSKCAGQHKKPGLSKEDVWLYIYADTLGYDPYDCDCEFNE